MKPSGVWCGNDRIRLRRRSSMPSSRSAWSTVHSRNAAASGRPAPRHGPVGTWSERVPIEVTLAAGIAYAPHISIAAVCGGIALLANR